jgi:phasin protein
MAEIGGLNRKRRDDRIMVSADQNRPIVGSGSSNSGHTSKKADKRRRKAAQKSDPKPDAAIAASEAPLQASGAPAEAPEVLAKAPDTPVEAPEAMLEALNALPQAPEQTLEHTELPAASTESVPAAASDTPPIAPAMPAESARPISVQTIASAYGCYAAKSLEQTGSFFEQLVGVRSFNKAFELQTAFAKQAYETFVAESQKIRELHSEMAKQRLSNLEGLMTGKKGTRSS